jgi:two-component system, NtrC family, sensor kinase
MSGSTKTGRQSSLHRGQQAPDGCGRSCRILIVDDDPLNLKVMGQILKDDYDLAFANSGVDALRSLKNNPADLVLLDVVMPGMDGYAVCEALKADLATRAIPVIFCTALHDGLDEAKGFNLGAVDYIAKPVRSVVVKARVRNHLDLAKKSALLRAKNRVLQHEQQEAEKSFLLEEAALRATANAVIITDRDGTIVWTNPAFTALTGYQDEEVRGKNPRILKSDQLSQEFYQDLWQTISSGHVWHGEFINRRKDGTSFIEASTITPVRIDGGEISHFVAVKRDITQQKEAERQRAMMEIQLRHAQKLESIGQLAAGIAHEINTPTQYIGDNARFLQEAFDDRQQVWQLFQQLLEAAKEGRVPEDLVREIEDVMAEVDANYLAQEIPEAIQHTLEGVERVTKIVRAMKNFSHPGSDEKTPIDLNDAIESTLTVSHNEWKYHADLVTDFDPALPPVPCLPGEFNQVILNLVINAAHAIADVVGDGSNGKGTLTVRTHLAGEWVEIRVEDTGSGIPEHARDRIFDPFFTTKTVGKGTGQGLAISRSVIVDKHGGTIDFETEPGHGTSFIVRLPLHGSAAR